MSVGAVPYAGAKNISECEKFIQILKKHTAAGKVYGAICAGCRMSSSALHCGMMLDRCNGG